MLNFFLEMDALIGVILLFGIFGFTVWLLSSIYFNFVWFSVAKEYSTILSQKICEIIGLRMPEYTNDLIDVKEWMRGASVYHSAIGRLVGAIKGAIGSIPKALGAAAGKATEAVQAAQHWVIIVRHHITVVWRVSFPNLKDSINVQLLEGKNFILFSITNPTWFSLFLIFLPFMLFILFGKPASWSTRIYTWFNKYIWRLKNISNLLFEHKNYMLFGLLIIMLIICGLKTTIIQDIILKFNDVYNYFKGADILNQSYNQLVWGWATFIYKAVVEIFYQVVILSTLIFVYLTNFIKLVLINLTQSLIKLSKIQIFFVILYTLAQYLARNNRYALIIFKLMNISLVSNMIIYYINPELGFWFFRRFIYVISFVVSLNMLTMISKLSIILKNLINVQVTVNFINGILLYIISKLALLFTSFFLYIAKSTFILRLSLLISLIKLLFKKVINNFSKLLSLIIICIVLCKIRAKKLTVLAGFVGLNFFYIFRGLLIIMLKHTIYLYKFITLVSHWFLDFISKWNLAFFFLNYIIISGFNYFYSIFFYLKDLAHPIWNKLIRRNRSLVTLAILTNFLLCLLIRFNGLLRYVTSVLVISTINLLLLFFVYLIITYYRVRVWLISFLVNTVKDVITLLAILSQRTLLAIFWLFFNAADFIGYLTLNTITWIINSYKFIFINPSYINKLFNFGLLFYTLVSFLLVYFWKFVVGFLNMQAGFIFRVCRLYLYRTNRVRILRRVKFCNVLMIILFLLYRFKVVPILFSCLKILISVLLICCTPLFFKLYKLTCRRLSTRLNRMYFRMMIKKLIYWYKLHFFLWQTNVWFVFFNYIGVRIRLRHFYRLMSTTKTYNFVFLNLLLVRFFPNLWSAFTYKVKLIFLKSIILLAINRVFCYTVFILLMLYRSRIIQYLRGKLLEFANMSHLYCRIFSVKWGKFSQVLIILFVMYLIYILCFKILLPLLNINGKHKFSIVTKNMRNIFIRFGFVCWIYWVTHVIYHNYYWMQFRTVWVFLIYYRVNPAMWMYWINFFLILEAFLLATCSFIALFYIRNLWLIIFFHICIIFNFMSWVYNRVFSKVYNKYKVFLSYVFKKLSTILHFNCTVLGRKVSKLMLLMIIISFICLLLYIFHIKYFKVWSLGWELANQRIYHLAVYLLSRIFFYMAAISWFYWTFHIFSHNYFNRQFMFLLDFCLFFGFNPLQQINRINFFINSANFVFFVFGTLAAFYVMHDIRLVIIFHVYLCFKVQLIWICKLILIFLRKIYIWLLVRTVKLFVLTYRFFFSLLRTIFWLLYGLSIELTLLGFSSVFKLLGVILFLIFLIFKILTYFQFYDTQVEILEQFYTDNLMNYMWGYLVVIKRITYISLTYIFFNKYFQLLFWAYIIFRVYRYLFKLSEWGRVYNAGRIKRYVSNRIIPKLTFLFMCFILYVLPYLTLAVNKHLTSNNNWVYYLLFLILIWFFWSSIKLYLLY